MFFKNIDQLHDPSESLEFDKDGEPTRRDYQLAVAVLLVTMAYQDREFLLDELEAIRSVLRDRFKLDKQKCESLINTAVLLRNNDRRLDFFLQTIQYHFTSAQKQTILSMLWVVAEADGVIHDVEAELATDLRIRLGLSMEEALHAREMAEVEW